VCGVLVPSGTLLGVALGLGVWGHFKDQADKRKAEEEEEEEEEEGQKAQAASEQQAKAGDDRPKPGEDATAEGAKRQASGGGGEDEEDDDDDDEGEEAVVSAWEDPIERKRLKKLLEESLPTFAKIRTFWKLLVETLKDKHDW
jgi:hypothetical protein